MMKKLIVLLAISASALTTAHAQQRPHPNFEISSCQLPVEVKIVREDENAIWWPPLPLWKTNRYNRYANEAGFAKMFTTFGTSGKNPEQNVHHAPGQMVNCYPGGSASSTQWLTFRVRTSGFFSSPAETWHIATLGKFSSSNDMTAYEAIGISLFTGHWGKQGVGPERASAGPGAIGTDAPRLDTAAGLERVMKDGVTYFVEMHLTPTAVVWRLHDSETNTFTDWRRYNQPAGYPPLSGTGVALAVLCSDPGGACEAYNKPFTVHFWDIATGFMN